MMQFRKSYKHCNQSKFYCSVLELETHRPTSDYDLLLICDSKQNPLELASLALLAARPRRFALDVSVLTPSEFKESLEEKTDFVWHAIQDAKVIYEKANPSLGFTG